MDEGRQRNVPMEEVVARLAAALTGARARVATAESCTGGWIAKVLTDRAGSSDWFGYGLVTYSNDAKASLLGVADETLARHGAVSRETVIEMARGVRDLAGCEYAVSVSGVAGPGGGTADKPVGTVWIAWATPAAIEAAHFRFPGDRKSIRWATVRAALEGLLARLERDA
jgi:nicotinamide-nucleotide amidase